MKMLKEDAQKAIELSLGKKHIKLRIDRAIQKNPEIDSKVCLGIELLKDWLSQTYYDSKEKRLKTLRTSNLELIVRTTFNVVAFCQTPELFTSVVGMLASTLNLPEKVDNIKTAAEILAVLCNTDAYDITKEHRDASLMIQCKFPLPTALLDSIQKSKYLPPMLVPPKKLVTNNDSPYLTLDKDCLVLGRGNSHTGDICLDVLNTQNNVELQLAKDFLFAMEELPPSNPEAHNIDNWNQFLAESKEVYLMILHHGGKFFLPNKVDKRGRIYSLGYHIHSQGYSFKKASVELANEEIVTM